MQRLVSGTDSALNDIMERHAPKLFNYLLRCLQNKEDASDAAQETFVRLYQHRSRFNPKQKFTTWLYAIASNLVKDRYRYRSRHPQVSLDAENESTGETFRENLREERETPCDSIAKEERLETVRRAVSNLPDELRTPLVLAEYEELSQSEIGEILGCSVKAVETRIYRARKELRKSLGAFFRD